MYKKTIKKQQTLIAIVATALIGALLAGCVPLSDSETASNGVAAQTQPLESEIDAPTTLANTSWQLQSIQMSDGSVMTAAEPANYVLDFAPDGTFAGRADCNNINGAYTEEEAQLLITGIASTRMMCPEGSLFDELIQSLEAANSYMLEDGHLLVSFGIDSGLMEFVPTVE